MKLSYILTTCCGDPLVSEDFGGGGLYKMTMSQRAELLDQEILPAAIPQEIDEIIVVGRFPDVLRDKWDSVMWLTLPPERRDRIEAFRQREVAARWSTGDIFIMSADDHKLADDFVKVLRTKLDNDWSLITPRRLHGQNLTVLNNGQADGYSPWHAQVLRRELWAQLPFTAHDTLWVDTILTTVYEKLNAKMVWDDDLVVYDCEAADDEA